MNCKRLLVFFKRNSRGCDYDNFCSNIGNKCVYNTTVVGSKTNLGFMREFCCCNTYDCNEPSQENQKRKCLKGLNCKHTGKSPFFGNIQFFKNSNF